LGSADFSPRGAVRTSWLSQRRRPEIEEMLRFAEHDGAEHRLSAPALEAVADLLLRRQRAEVGTAAGGRARGHAAGLRLLLNVRADAADEVARRLHRRIDGVDV